MGACCSSVDGKKRERQTAGGTADLQMADPNSSQVGDSYKKDEDFRITLLKHGRETEVDGFLNSLDDINEYIFGSNKTVLHQAVIFS